VPLSESPNRFSQYALGMAGRVVVVWLAPKPHVGRHAGAPRLHRGSEGANATVAEVRSDRETERPGTHDSHLELIGQV
jgi:hypothetical protein